MVIVMEPARALSADVGSLIFGSSKEGLTCIGNKLDRSECPLMPLSTKWNKQICHWPKNMAKAAFGFCEVM